MTVPAKLNNNVMSVAATVSVPAVTARGPAVMNWPLPLMPPELSILNPLEEKADPLKLKAVRSMPLTIVG